MKEFFLGISDLLKIDGLSSENIGIMVFVFGSIYLLGYLLKYLSEIIYKLRTGRDAPKNWFSNGLFQIYAGAASLGFLLFLLFIVLGALYILIKILVT